MNPRISYRLSASPLIDAFPRERNIRVRPKNPTTCSSNVWCSLERKDPQASYSLSTLWREIQGSRNWQDMVHPLHPLLRNEAVRYGEFANACYKAFDIDPSSDGYLTCKYGKDDFLQQVGLESSGCQVTKYVYATPDIGINLPIQKEFEYDSRWIGYVAVANDEEAIKKLGRRDIVIAFRGTVSNFEWIANMMSSLTPAKLDPLDPREDVKVELGFLSLYTSHERPRRFGLPSCRDQLLSEVSRLLRKYQGEELSISIAGHSMGSSLALLHAYDISELGLNKAHNGTEVPVTVYSFGGPRVGNLSFKERCQQLGVKVLRIVNINDPVTKVPGIFLNEKNSGELGDNLEQLWKNLNFSCYVHVGVELVLDFFNIQNPSCVHDLETYINLLKCPKASLGSKVTPDTGNSLGKRNSNLKKPVKHLSQKLTDFLQSRETDYFFHRYLYRVLDSLNVDIM